MKNHPYLKHLTNLSAALIVGLSVNQASAQTQVFSEDFEIDHSLDNTYATNSTPLCVTLTDLYFDYNTAGIPLSPHSATSSTRALKMCANLQGGVFGGVSVSPLGFAITDNFDMRFDAWFNFNGPMPGGGSGSTQVGGAGYGTAGTTAQVAGVADSVFIGATADGGSSADYRVYSPSHQASYQDGDFRIGSDGLFQTTHGDPETGYIYAGTNRNNSGAYYTSNFPGQPAPAAQLSLYPQQTGTAANGTMAFKWHDISLKKIGNTITYTIDGVLIATVDVTDAGTLGGQNILFNQYDINASSSTDPNRTNLNFTLIDNVRITNFANVVTVVNTNGPSVVESNLAAPGVFTFVRSTAGVPLTVSYTLSGSAVNGVDFTNLPGSVTFAAGDLSTNVYVEPIDDSIPELTEKVLLDITSLSDPNYIGGGSASVAIIDDDKPQLTIAKVSSQMYERTNDFAVFKVSRLGNTNVASFNVNLQLSGTATLDVDYYMTNTLTFEPGVQTTNFVILPIEDLSYEGNETITATVGSAAGSDYTVGTPSSDSVTLVDADAPPETVLFSDNFNADSSANWNVFFATTNGAPDDYTILWAQDYSVFGIPASPHGGGDTTGLFMTVNKNDQTPVAAALNAYPKLKTFSGNFAVRFDMSLNISASGSATEYAMVGINHSGTKTNWWRSGGIPGGGDFDGIFYTIESDAGALPNFANYSSPTTAGNNPTNFVRANSSSFTQAFKAPPFAIAGSPAVNRTNAVQGPYWADVELSQIGSLITLRINKQAILSYTNGTSYSSGDIMLGYEDAFDSIGDAQGNFVFYDNLRVISLTSPAITQIKVVGENVQIDFTANAGDVVAQFVLQSAQNVAGPYVDTGLTPTSLGGGSFRSTVAYSPLDPPKFFRIRRAY